MIPSESTPDLESAVEEFIRVARRAADLGLQSGTGGNISLRCGSRFLIKASGISLYGLSRPDIVALGDDATVLAGPGKPSKEAGFHLGIYRERPEIGGVVHYHAPFATAYAVQGVPIPRVTIHSKRCFPKMPVVRELPDGSPELAAAVVDAFRDRDVRLILLTAHGLVAIGRTLTEAHALAELAEETARTAFVAQRLAGA